MSTHDRALATLRQPPPAAPAPNPDQGRFDLEAFHAMEARDNALIADELIHGALSHDFVYAFPGSDGHQQVGVSVVGARHLAAIYGGIRHRLVFTMTKTGSRIIGVTHPAPGVPMVREVMYSQVEADQPDFAYVLVEMTDSKKGNVIQVEITEERTGYDRNGTAYDKPHYAKIAASKAFRNGVLELLPQDVVKRFRDDCAAQDRNGDLTRSAIQDKRSTVLAYATSRGLAIERRTLQELTLDQISGLSDAARAGPAPFTAALDALGLMQPGRTLDLLALAPAPTPAPTPKAQPTGNPSASPPPAGEGEESTDLLPAAIQDNAPPAPATTVQSGPQEPPPPPAAPAAPAPPAAPARGRAGRAVAMDQGTMGAAFASVE